MKILARLPWLLPVVGVVAVLAVGIAGALIGVNFASHKTTTTSAGTAIAPIVEPVAVGNDAIAALKSANVAKAPKINSSGNARIVLSGSSTAIDPTLARAMDAAAHSSTPAIDPTVGGFATAATGDRCALLPPPTSGCPAGLLGSVAHILHDPPAFGLVATAYPPTTAEWSAGHGWLLDLHCDADPAHGVPIGILASMPATYQVSVAPISDPRSVRVLPTSSPAAGEVAAFAAALMSDGAPNPIGSTRCVNADGLRAATAYVGTVTGTDYLGRASQPYTIRFNTSGAPTHPGAQISTIGSNIVVVQGLHNSSERVEVRATTLHEHTTVPATCNNAGRAGDDLTQFAHYETTATADQIAQLNAPAGYTGRTTITFNVPEGSDTLVCVRWYPSVGSPSWQQDAPNYESRAIAAAPDRTLPRVTLERIRLNTITSAGFSVATVEGTQCGRFGWFSDHGSQGPVALCDNYWLARGGASAAGERLWDRGFSGDLAVSTVTVSADERHTERFVLPLARDTCFGYCPTLPSPAEYNIPLTGNVNDGYAVFRVDWTQGYSNGRSDWVISPTEDQAIASPPSPNFPQLNTDVDWQVNVPRTDQDWGNAIWSIGADRPVHYDLKLTLQPGVAAPSCKPGQGALEVTGELADAVNQSVEFDGVCLGTSYHAEITLDDHAGHVVTWSENNVASWWPPETSRVHVPGVRARLQYVVDAQGFPHSTLTQLTMTVGGVSLPNGVQPDALCSETGHFHGEGAQDVVLSSHTTLHLLMRISAAGTFSQLTNPDGTAVGPPQCNDVVEGRLIDIPFTIDLLSVLYSSGQDAPCVGENLNASTPYPLHINVCALYAGLGR